MSVQGVLAEELAVVGHYRDDRLVSHECEQLAQDVVRCGNGPVEQVHADGGVLAGQRVPVLCRGVDPHADDFELPER